jgi:large subunit ribosomal protein L24
MGAAKIRKGDTVVVLAGRDKDKSGEVLSVLPKEGRAVVRGVNMVRRHKKADTRTGEQGGIISKEGSINLSNLAVADPKDGKPTRIGFMTQPDGTKVRVARRSKEIIRDKD